MEYINSHPELNAEVQFGTLADYFNSVNADSKSLSLIEKKDPEHFFPTLSGDFFTYADRDDHYWSGMYLFHKESIVNLIRHKIFMIKIGFLTQSQKSTYSKGNYCIL